MQKDNLGKHKITIVYPNNTDKNNTVINRVLWKDGGGKHIIYKGCYCTVVGIEGDYKILLN